MSAIRRARAAAVPTAWVIPDLRQWTLRAGAFVFCLAAALLLTALRLEITRLRYDLSELHRQREATSAAVARMEVEKAALTAPRGIEEQARKMGFVFPDRNSIVVLDE